MSNFGFWQKWLVVVSILIVVAGVLLALFSGSVFFDLLNPLINPAFWGTTPIGESAAKFQKFVYGILGATMAGWAIFMAFIAQNAFRKKEKWASDSLLVGMLAWYVLDTGISAYYAVYANVIANTAFLILVLLPVIVTRKEFANQSE
jgi:hypothetical protein